jgi:CRP/FNR family transcriptional regulator, cyclic AMP receptor protein
LIWIKAQKREAGVMFLSMNNYTHGGRAALEAQVAAHPFLLGLGPAHVRLLADCAMQSQFQPDEIIFREGEMANRFYLVERGRVALESSTGDQVVRIDEVGAGDLLGWSWIFPPYRWHFDARAIEATTAIFFYGTILRDYCEKDPVLGYELFKRMSEVMMRRLQAARAKLSESMKSASS